MSDATDNTKTHQKAGAMFAALTETEKARDLPAIRLTDEEWYPHTPAPSEPELPCGASFMWVYRDAKGQAIYARVRFDKTDKDGKPAKDIRPLTYGRRVWTDKEGRRHDVTGWHFKQPSKPLPLYGLDRLASHPDALVLLTEGEKAADSAQALFPDMVVMTSGGSSSTPSVNWTPLRGRSVVIWPDNDKAGLKYAQDATDALIRAGAFLVRVVTIPQAFPDRWDLADPPPPELAAGDDSTQALRTLIAQAPVSDASVTMPPGYSMGKGGLYFTPEAKGDDLPSPVWVCARFEIVATTRDERGGSWGLLIRWQDPDGNPHQWAIPKQLVHGEGRDLAGELEKNGLNCNVSQHTKLKQFIASVKTKERLKCVNKAGWHQTERGHVFVLPDSSVFGPGRDLVAYQVGYASTGSAYTQAGTLEDWKEHIATYARENSRLSFALCVSFMGPLLDVAGEQSGGFHFHGNSQTGKSTALYVAGSVWGAGSRNGQVRTWRLTSNGLEGIAEETSDMLLMLDEMGEVNGKEAGDVVYMLANEGGKQRAGRNGEARARKTWRCSLLSTGEITLAEKMNEVGLRPMAGQEVRLVNIPMDAGAGYGCFDSLRQFSKPEVFAEAIKEAAATHYGTAGRTFLEKLTSERASDAEALRSVIRDIVRAFTQEALPDGSGSGQVASVARRFALAAAAGELATSYSILPWKYGEATQAALTCFRVWLDERGGTGSAEARQAISQVRSFIEANGESRFSLAGASDGNIRTNNRAGYRRVTGLPGGQSTEYLIFPQQWKDAICKGINSKQAAQALINAGLMVPGNDGKMTRVVKDDQGKACRMYVVKGDILSGGARDDNV